jgi:molybdopterin/thiamine biosynthesis adenylyltransferase
MIHQARESTTLTAPKGILAADDDDAAVRKRKEIKEKLMSGEPILTPYGKMLTSDSIGKKKKKIVFLPDEILKIKYTGLLYGKYIETTGVFNVLGTEPENGSLIGFIGDSVYMHASPLIGKWQPDGTITFSCLGEDYTVHIYDLIQNVFSRNTGILESGVMLEKCAFILGCGSVGSLVALELARSGVGKFVLADNDIVEYHNLCRHQCSITDIGEYKVDAVKRRIVEINPDAIVSTQADIVENVGKAVFDEFCKGESAVIIGCADNRMADVYANKIAVSYKTPFVSIGLWERAFAGEIFYWLPESGLPCYTCALGSGGDFSGRQSVNRRVYTNEADVQTVNFEPGISADINFVTTVGIKLILDILNRTNTRYTQRLLDNLQQYTLVCNTNKPAIGGDMAEIFSYPLQVTTSLQVNHRSPCPPCRFE